MKQLIIMDTYNWLIIRYNIDYNDYTAQRESTALDQILFTYLTNPVIAAGEQGRE